MLYDLEDIGTWPHPLIVFLAEHEDFLQECRSYELTLYQRLSSNDDSVSWKARMEGDPYADNYNRLRPKINNYLKGNWIKGYHCTRLTKREVKNIKDHGLQVLSKSLLQKKLGWAIQDGYINEDERDLFLSNNQVLEKNRSGQICLVQSKSLLKEKLCVYRLFRSWGGEALYNSHEEEHTGVKLRNIGEPTIVVCKTLISDLTLYSRIEDIFVNNYMYQNGYQDFESEQNRKIESRVTSNISSEDIIDLVDFDDEQFLKFTSFDKWEKDYAIDPAYIHPRLK